MFVAYDRYYDEFCVYDYNGCWLASFYYEFDAYNWRDSICCE